MKKVNPSVVDEALLNLFAHLPAEVADRVKAKYEEDRIEFVEFVKEQNPSNKPGYWAHKECKKCYGRGVLGTFVGSGTPLLCGCVAKSYQAWLTEQRAIFNNRSKDEK